jgi:purine-nucleoside phosphorylase
LIRDHISLTAATPLVGATFVDLTDLYSKRLRAIVKSADSSLEEGVYVHWRGPTYETPAEILMMRGMGADLVGMSTVPEAIAAHALGAEVLAISLVTNAAAGVTGEKLNHEEVIAAGKAAASRMGALMKTVIPNLI